MKISNTSERLKQIMNERNLRQADVLRLCEPIAAELKIKMNSAYLSQVISGKFEPSQDKIYLLSKALHVSEAFLMGFEDQAPTYSPSTLTQDETNLLSDYRKLNQDGQQEARKRVGELAEITRYTKRDAGNSGTAIA